MNRLALLVLCLLLLEQRGYAQTAPELAASIDSMAQNDQYWRNMYVRISQSKDSTGSYLIRKNISWADAANLRRLRVIVRDYGFPGFKMVGAQSSNNFWVLVQHADAAPGFQDTVLKLMERAVKAKDASGENFAYLTDRVRLNTGRKQLYGTQARLNAAKTSYIPAPVEDSARLDARRAAVGLEPIADYLRGMNDLYPRDLRQH